VPFAGFDDWEDCMTTMTEEEGHDEDSAESICGALEAEAKSDAGNVDQLREALAAGSGLVADVGVDLVSGVDVPAVDSKWTMMKSGGARKGHDWRADSRIVLSKADDDGEERRISYAAAMIPREPDKEGDVVPTPTVERAAHDFLKNDGGIDTDHSLIDGEGQPVESWVLKEQRTFDLPNGGTETYAAGTWMLGVEWGAEAWERIKSGDLTGLSIYGMAEHVPLERAASACSWDDGVAKDLTVPFADEVVVDLVYGAQVAAEKAADEMGMDKVAHQHTLDDRTVWMPGPDHETYVEAYNDIAEAGETAASLSTTQSESGDSLTKEGENTEHMGSDSTTDDNGGDGDAGATDEGPTLGEVASSVESLTDTVASIKDAVETEKQDAQEAAAMLADEYDMGTGDVLDILSAAEGADPDAVLDAINDADAEEAEASAETVANEDGEGDDEDDEEEEKAADDVEKRTDEAHMAKGHDGTATAQDGVTGDGGAGGMPSYAAAAEQREGGN
jgi:hypothetical protein